VLEVAAYYIVTAGRGYPVNRGEISFWVLCALAGGPAFGWGGWTWRSGPPRLRPAGGALLAATWLAEAVGTYQLRLHDRSAALLFLATGLALLAGLASASADVRHRLAVTAAITLVAALVGVAVYWQVLDALFVVVN
jgi:hypothetical protein